MKLLIFTQKVDVNDPILGFFHRWIIEFAKHVEFLTVICLEEGKHDLPDNVRVFSLGKESDVSKARYILNFYSYIWRFRKDYDSVFVHMNQIYVIMGGLFWRLWNKKISLWYAHGSVPFSLRVSEKLVTKIITSTESGFRIESNKKNVVGQGIDTLFFRSKKETDNNSEVFKIISVGRISPVKDYETTIDAVEILHKKNINFDLTIVGGAGLESQQDYLYELKASVVDKGLGNKIHFIGPVPNHEVLPLLQSSHLYINTSHTGSLDKTILEAMAVEVPVMTCNEALNEILGEYRNILMFPKKEPESLADGIEKIINMVESERSILGQNLRDIVTKDHDVAMLIKKIIRLLE